MVSRDAATPPHDLPPLASASPRVKRFVVGAFGLSMGLTIGGTAFTPYLLVEHPLLLIALSPEGRNFILGAAQLGPVELITVGTVRRTLAMLANYGLGALYGHHVIAWMEGRFPRFGRGIRWFERLVRRLGPGLLVISPGYSVSVLSGACGMALVPVAVALTLGTAIWLTLVYYLGEAVSQWSELLIAFLAEHMVASTAVCVAAVTAQQLWSRHRRKGRSALAELTER